CWIEEESLSRRDKKLFTLSRRLKKFGFLNRFPSFLQCFRAWSCWPQRLKERHRLAPVSHCAAGVDHRDVLERFTRLRVGHVMQERQRMIKLFLRLGRAANRKINDAQMLTDMLL